MSKAAPQPPREVLDGVWLFQSPLWQTNSTLVERDGHILLCDPAFFEPEIEAIRTHVSGRSVQPPVLLLTHGDFDHTCGIPYFLEAEVVAGPDTTERVESGEATESLASGLEWGASWPGELRVDRTVEPGSQFRAGVWTIEAIGAPSHGREGTAYAVLDEGLLLPGDHVSAITIPLLANLARAIEATEQLLEALDRLELRLVLPGHGSAHAADEARRIAEEDLAYLRALRDAASEAVAGKLPSGYALLHVYAVVPPRGDTADFEIYAIRAGNARIALREAEAAR